MAELAQPGEPINSFAAVCYLPGEIGEYLTRVRAELVEGCVARSHVSILPPRPLAMGVSGAEEFFRRTVSACTSFTLELTGIETFDTTGVVFLGIGDGEREIRSLHDQLNTGPLYFHEPYPFHPHVTLAQGIPPGRLREFREAATRCWQEVGSSAAMMIESVTLVQNTSANCWIDRLDCRLLHGLTADG